MSTDKSTNSPTSVKNLYRTGSAEHVALLMDVLKPLLDAETDAALLDCVRDDLAMHAGDDEMTILALRIWIRILKQDLPHERTAYQRTPRWQQIKERCDKLPDTPRSRWERNGLRIARAAQAGRSAV